MYRASAAAAVDRYGHPLPKLTKEEAAARNAMISSEAIKARAWSYTPVSALTPKKLKLLIRDGIPMNLRPSIWLELSGGQALKQEQAPGYFAGLLARPASKSCILDMEAAIACHMPSHQYLSAPFGLQAAASVMQAYHIHTARRVQPNLCCIAAFLVSVLGLGREEDCFWIMTGLLDHRLPASCTQEVTPNCTSIEHLVLNELLRKRCPRFVATFKAMDYSLVQLTSTWFSHLFCGTLPAETVVRVWDVIISEPKALFRVALALLKRQESIVVGNPHMIRTIGFRISRTYNADDLLKMAFKGIGSLPMAVITRTRCSVETSVLQERAHQAKRLEALLSPARLSPQPSVSSAGDELATIVELPETGGEESGQDGVLSFQMRLAPIRT